VRVPACVLTTGLAGLSNMAGLDGRQQPTGGGRDAADLGALGMDASEPNAMEVP